MDHTLDVRDLPDLQTLRNRCAVKEVFLAACFGDEDRGVQSHGWTSRDGGGTWFHVALVAGGRAVLFGWDRDFTRTTDAGASFDLRAGLPAWAAAVVPDASGQGDPVGFAAVWQDGTWRSADHGVEDGLSTAVKNLRSADSFDAMCTEYFYEVMDTVAARGVEVDDSLVLDRAALDAVVDLGPQARAEDVARLIPFEGVDTASLAAVAARYGTPTELAEGQTLPYAVVS